MTESKDGLELVKTLQRQKQLLALVLRGDAGMRQDHVLV